MPRQLTPPLISLSVRLTERHPAELAPHFLHLADAEEAGWKAVTVNLDLTNSVHTELAKSVRRTLAGEDPGSQPVLHSICWDRGSSTHCYLMRRATEIKVTTE